VREEILTTLARRAIAGRSLTVMSSRCSLLPDGRSEGNFETGIQTALGRLLVLRNSSSASSASSRMSSRGLYRLTDVELASRLSFFSGALSRTTSCSMWRRAADSRIRKSLKSRFGACWPIPARRH
jgi:hypothetical protein